MKVRRILPCVCIDHKPDHTANGYDGNPELRLYGGEDGYSFSAYCPCCGRDTIDTYKTSYLALKAWNKIQRTCWNDACTDFWTGELKPDIEPWRAEFYRELSKEAAQ